MKLRLASVIAAAVVVACVATGCTAEAPVSPKTEPGSAASEQMPEEVAEVLDDALGGSDAEGDDGRAFGATQEIVIEAVERTFANKNAHATWDGTTLIVKLDGSVDDPIASLPCSALEALLADGESAVIIFDDGDLICADRYNNG